MQAQLYQRTFSADRIIYTKAPPLVLVCYPFHLPLKLLLSDGTNQKPSLTKSFKDPVRDVSDRKHKYYRNNK